MSGLAGRTTGGGGNGTESLPMNNTLMSSLPITAKPPLPLRANGDEGGEGGLWGKSRQRDRGGGSERKEKKPAGSL